MLLFERKIDLQGYKARSSLHREIFYLTARLEIHLFPDLMKSQWYSFK